MIMRPVLPLLLSVIFLFRFHGSMLNTVVFFLLLIVGVILPQVYQDFIRTHLLLKKEVDALLERLSPPGSEEDPSRARGGQA